MWEQYCECEYSSLVWRFLFGNRRQPMRISANFRTVFSESQNASPLDVEPEPEPDFNAKWPFKVILFGGNEEPLRGYVVQYNNCGHECEGSEDIANERSENRHLRLPHTHLTYKLRSLGYIAVADSMGLSSFKFLWWAPKDMWRFIGRKIAKIASSYPPQSQKSPSLGVTPIEFRDEPAISRN